MGRSRQRTPNTAGESTCEWRYVFVRHDIAAILQNRWREPVRRVSHRCIRRTCLDYVIVINPTGSTRRVDCDQHVATPVCADRMSRARSRKHVTRTAPGCGLRNGVRILITFLRVIAVEVIYWIDLSLRSRPTLIDHC
jgi:hypothetical protein